MLRSVFTIPSDECTVGHALRGAGHSSSSQPGPDDPVGVAGTSFTVEMGQINLTGDYHRRRDGDLRNRKATTTLNRLCTARDPSLACNFLRTGK